jgi:putative hemolysin
MIRTFEALAGRPRLQAMYDDWAAYDKRPLESVFDAALRVLQVDLRIDGAEHLRAVPRSGGLLLVANHPYGIIDGLILGHLGIRLRDNVHILTNSVLCNVPEVQPHLLPVDFAGTPDARRLTGQTRKRATQLLADGQVVAIFPGGGIATANHPMRGRAVDSIWHPFVGRLATLPGVTTLPVHFAGQNSRMFQMASHMSYALRLAMIFHETRRLEGGALPIMIGAPLSDASLHTLHRTDIAQALRRITMALAGDGHHALDEAFVWPRHVRF